MTLMVRCHDCGELSPAPVPEGTAREDLLLEGFTDPGVSVYGWQALRVPCPNEACGDFGREMEYSAKFFVEVP